MRTGIWVVFIVFLTTVVPSLGLCASPAHIQAHVTLNGQALGRTLADQDLLLEAWEEGAKSGRPPRFRWRAHKKRHR